MAYCVVNFTLCPCTFTTTSVHSSTDTEHGLLDVIGSVSATNTVSVYCNAVRTAHCVHITVYQPARVNCTMQLK
jgi:hypothetical protein